MLAKQSKSFQVPPGKTMPSSTGAHVLSFLDEGLALAQMISKGFRKESRKQFREDPGFNWTPIEAAMPNMTLADRKKILATLKIVFTKLQRLDSPIPPLPEESPNDPFASIRVKRRAAKLRDQVLMLAELTPAEIQTLLQRQIIAMQPVFPGSSPDPHAVLMTDEVPALPPDLLDSIREKRRAKQMQAADVADQKEGSLLRLHHLTLPEIQALFDVGPDFLQGFLDKKLLEICLGTAIDGSKGNSELARRLIETPYFSNRLPANQFEKKMHWLPRASFAFLMGLFEAVFAVVAMVVNLLATPLAACAYSAGLVFVTAGFLVSAFLLLCKTLSCRPSRQISLDITVALGVAWLKTVGSIFCLAGEFVATALLTPILPLYAFIASCIGYYRCFPRGGKGEIMAISNIIHDRWGGQIALFEDHHYSYPPLSFFQRLWERFCEWPVRRHQVTVAELAEKATDVTDEQEGILDKLERELGSEQVSKLCARRPSASEDASERVVASSEASERGAAASDKASEERPLIDPDGVVNIDLSP